MIKPGDVYDREPEWSALTDFVMSNRSGATLGLVYGRRRQGKTYLLQALTEVAGGLYFAALRQSSDQNLARLADAYRGVTGGRARVTFGSWTEAIEALLALGQDMAGPIPVVLDEFPYLVAAAPELPSVVQALLSPRGDAATGWPTRLVLCGSALSTMRGLLSGTAPLRGRASLELVVRPFDYRAAAHYWGADGDPELAFRLHALVGGTPAYLDMCGGAGPASSGELDVWVARVLLNPASAMFREGNVLLSEEEGIVDTSLYFSVLAAISQGRCRRSEIAASIGRPQTSIAHPLAVLTETGLVASQVDALRQKRSVFHIAEPVLRLHQLAVAPHEARLARHRGQEVWESLADTVRSKIYGPHFETIARAWCSDWASSGTLGGVPSMVAATEVACREHRSTHEVDVVVREANPGVADRIVALGEAKWHSRPVDVAELRRLEHLRDLLGTAGTTVGTRLLLFSRKGFTADVEREASARGDVELVDLARLYSGD